MSQPPLKQPSNQPSNQPLAHLLLSLTVPPVLLVLAASRPLAELMIELGQASEELFRGDRLPVLKTSPTAPSDSPAPPE